MLLIWCSEKARCHVDGLAFTQRFDIIRLTWSEAHAVLRVAISQLKGFGFPDLYSSVHSPSKQTSLMILLLAIFSFVYTYKQRKMRSWVSLMVRVLLATQRNGTDAVICMNATIVRFIKKIRINLSSL